MSMKSDDVFIDWELIQKVASEKLSSEKIEGERDKTERDKTERDKKDKLDKKIKLREITEKMFFTAFYIGGKSILEVIEKMEDASKEDIVEVLEKEFGLEKDLDGFSDMWREKLKIRKGLRENEED